VVVNPQGGPPHRLTPTAPARAQILIAALMWTLAGACLCIAGAVWALGAHWRHAIAALAIAAIVGALKARFFLDKTARRIVRRIAERGDGRCVGGFLSWRSWLLVAAMVLLGRLLRMSPLPVAWRGAIYFAIGAALMIASRAAWSAWRGFRA
jgi:hypothetical protein